MIPIKDACDGVREKLREATVSLHAELDGIAEALLAVGKEGYARFLAGQGAVIIPLEKRLEISGIGKVVPDWPLRARRYELKADLREIAQPCDFLEVPTFRTPAELMGAAYVLEGSRLGAALLLRTLELSAATRFLRHGQGKGLWPSFLHEIETNIDVNEHLEKTKLAATLVLQLFIQAMGSAARVTALTAAE